MPSEPECDIVGRRPLDFVQAQSIHGVLCAVFASRRPLTCIMRESMIAAEKNSTK